MRNETMTVGELYEKVNAGQIKSDIDVQREIVYNDEKQRLVIDSLIVGVPLPAFYFWETDGGVLEVLDGKQRINAITRYIQNDLEYENKIWRQMDAGIQAKLKSVPLTCIVCSGEDKLKREIFRRINTLGVPLSSYEVLNGLHHGEYLRGLTKYVTGDKGATKALGDAARGKRQMRALKYLLILNGIKPTIEAIHDWVGERKTQSFAEDQRTLDKHIDFCADVFTDMGLVDIYFNLSLKYLTDKPLWKRNKAEINTAIKAHKKTDDWKLSDAKAKNADIEAIILATVGGIRLDPRRLFTADQKQALLDQQTPVDGKYLCAHCSRLFFPGELQMDHVEAWSKGGRTEISNAQLLCRPCHDDKGTGEL